MDPFSPIALWLVRELGNVCCGVAGNVSHDALRPVYQRMQDRWAAGQVPPNHHLERALRRAMSRAAQALAWHLHEPFRLAPPSPGVAAGLTGWIHELEKKLAGTIPDPGPEAAWLKRLLSAAKQEQAFQDLAEHPAPVTKALDAAALSKWTRLDAEPDMARWVNGQFLDWIGKHVGPLSECPEKYRHALAGAATSGGGQGDGRTFFHFVCLFFREAIKTDPTVFHGYSMEFYESFHQELAGLRAQLPAPGQFDRLLAAVERIHAHPGNPSADAVVAEAMERGNASQLQASLDQLHDAVRVQGGKLDRLLQLLEAKMGSPETGRPVFPWRVATLGLTVVLTVGGMAWAWRPQEIGLRRAHQEIVAAMGLADWQTRSLAALDRLERALLEGSAPPGTGITSEELGELRRLITLGLRDRAQGILAEQARRLRQESRSSQPPATAP